MASCKSGFQGIVPAFWRPHEPLLVKCPAQTPAVSAGDRRNQGKALAPSLLCSYSQPVCNHIQPIDDTGEFQQLRICDSSSHSSPHFSLYLLPIYVTNLTSCLKFFVAVCCDRWSAVRGQTKTTRLLHVLETSEVGSTSLAILVASGVPSSDYTSLALIHLVHSQRSGSRRDSLQLWPRQRRLRKTQTCIS